MNRYMLATIVLVGIVISPATKECIAFSLNDARTMVQLLNEEKFNRIEEILRETEKAYKMDFMKEHEDYLTWKSFGVCQKNLEVHFNNWVRARPAAPYGYLARAVYYENMGWALRGGRYANETSKKQFSDMTSYHEKAYSDVTKSLDLDASLMHAYYILIGIMRAEGKDSQAVVEKALTINPYSYYARAAYLNALIPRWGGSRKRMQDFIDTIKPYYDKNPRLKALEGRYAIELGDQFYYNNQYSEALDYYNQALVFGDSSLVYNKLGKTLARLQRYNEAIERYNKALNIDPLLTDARYGRAESCYYLKDYAKAGSDTGIVLEMNPYDAAATNLRGLINAVNGRYEKAVRDFERAAELDPINTGYQQNIEKARESLRNKRER